MKAFLTLALLASACTKDGRNSSENVDTTDSNGQPSQSDDSAAQAPEAPEATKAEVLNSLADNIALSHFQDLQERSAALIASATELCTNPSADTLDATRADWWSTRTPWKNAEIVQFGPIEEYPERVGPKIDDWPVNQQAVDDKLASDDPLDLEAFKIMGTATRGLPVIEYLLWGAGTETLAQISSNPRRCDMVLGAAQDVHANAGILIKAWNEDWYDQLRGQAEGSGLIFKNEKDVLDKWVNRLIFTTEIIRETKLGKPKGDKANGSPQPDLIESRPSGRSLQDSLDVLAGIEQVWSGDLNGNHPAIRDLVRNDNQLIEQVDNLFVVSRQRLSEVPETLEETIYSQPELIDRAQTALLELQRVLQSDVAANIGITVRFGNDGD